MKWHQYDTVTTDPKVLRTGLERSWNLENPDIMWYSYCILYIIIYNDNAAGVPHIGDFVAAQCHVRLSKCWPIRSRSKNLRNGCGGFRDWLHGCGFCVFLTWRSFVGTLEASSSFRTGDAYVAAMEGTWHGVTPSGLGTQNVIDWGGHVVITLHVQTMTLTALRWYDLCHAHMIPSGLRAGDDNIILYHIRSHCSTYYAVPSHKGRELM